MTPHPASISTGRSQSGLADDHRSTTLRSPAPSAKGSARSAEHATSNDIRTMAAAGQSHPGDRTRPHNIRPIAMPHATPSTLAHPGNLLPLFLLILITGLLFPSIAFAQMVMDNDNEMEAAQQRKADHLPPYTIVYCGKNVTDPNKPESLPAGDYDSDLHVVGPCVADGVNGGGVYKYHWVFIHQGDSSDSTLHGTLTFNDAQLDLYANSILVLNGGTLQAGGASAASAIAKGPVTIHLWGADTNPAIPCEDENGNEDSTCGIDPAIWTSNKIDLTKIIPPPAPKRHSRAPENASRRRRRLLLSI